MGKHVKETKQLDGGRTWTKGIIAAEGWDSDDGNFRIVPSARYKGKVILIAFEHEDENGEFLTKFFDSVEAAMEHAEKM